MTRDVVSVTEDTDLGEVAALLEAKRIKRVPVTRDGKVIGIISRANLVRALAAAKGVPPSEGEADDRMIRGRLLAELGREEWARVWPEDIIVRDGVVHFWLSSDEPEENKQALRVAAKLPPASAASRNTSCLPRCFRPSSRVLDGIWCCRSDDAYAPIAGFRSSMRSGWRAPSQGQRTRLPPADLASHNPGMPKPRSMPAAARVSARLPPSALDIPSNIFGYVLAESGWHQLALAVLTAILSPLF
jgi:hypothetical protein